MNENHDSQCLGPGWVHLFVQDHREEESKATGARESARRRGRKTKDWWKKYLPHEQKD